MSRVDANGDETGITLAPSHETDGNQKTIRETNDLQSKLKSEGVILQKIKSN